MLTARAENHLRGRPDLDDTIARLQAFESAGADVLYAPGLRTLDEMRAVCSAVSRPVNVLASPGSPSPSSPRRVRSASASARALTWVAVEAAAGAARQLLEGDLSGLRSSPPLDDWFR